MSVTAHLIAQIFTSERNLELKRCATELEFAIRQSRLSGKRSPAGFVAELNLGRILTRPGGPSH